VIIVGDEIVKSDALQEAPNWRKRWAAPAYQSSTPYGAHFLSESPCFMGALARMQKSRRETLAPYDLMIALGGDPLRMSVYSETDPLPDGCRSCRSAWSTGSRQELRRRDRAQGRRARRPCARWCRR
jgi:benzoylformate decarboxylase